MTFTQKGDWLFIVLASIFWFSALSVIVWDFVILQKMVWRLDLVALTGICLVGVGIALRVHARITLGRYFLHGLRIVEGHQLIRKGMYHYVRHPSYLGIILIYVGTPPLFHSFYGLLLMLPLIPLIVYRIRIEEAMLVETFGDEYKEYTCTSKKLLPYLY